MSEFKILNQSLPCASCKSECCGSFPLGTQDFKKIVKHLSAKSDAELNRLQAAKRSQLDCCFLDTENWRCGVYEVRPLVCDLYGRTPVLACNHLPKSTMEFTEGQALAMMTFDVLDQDYKCHSGALSLMTNKFHKIMNPVGLDWNKIRQAITDFRRKTHGEHAAVSGK